MDTTTSTTTTEMNISSLDLAKLCAASITTFTNTVEYVWFCVTIGNSLQTKYPAFDRMGFYAECDFDSALGTEWRDWRDWE